MREPLSQGSPTSAGGSMSDRCVLRGLFILGIGVTALLAPFAAGSQLERVFHSTEATLPGFSGAFQGFDGVNVSGSTVTFRVRGTDYQGIFAFSGGSYQNLIDTATVIPQLGVPLSIVREPTVSGSSMVFTGRSPGPMDGVYIQDAAGTRLMVGSGLPNPVFPAETVHPYLSSVAYADGRAIFHDASTTGGYYQYDGEALSALVYRGQTIPGTAQTFQWFDNSVWAKGDTTVFIAGPDGFVDGIWKATPSMLTAVITEGQPIPGATGKTFNDLGSPRFNSHGDTAFLGSGPFVDGVYVADTGGVRRITDSTIQWGGRHVSISPLLDNFALNDEVVVFGAIIDSGGGTAGFLPEMFFADLETGGLSLFLKRGDVVDGRIVATSRAYPYSFDGDRLAIGIRFTDGTSGIYLATVPAPAGVWILSLLLMPTARRNR